MVEPYRANEFVVEIDTIRSPNVTKVSGLSMGETDTVVMTEGGTNIVHKVSGGSVKFAPLVIERFMDGSKDDADFKGFFETMFKLGASGSGSTVRRNGSIVKSHFGVEVFRIAFYAAWVKSSTLSDLVAGSNELMKQTIVMEHDGLEFIPTS
jgi:phage tail-like protein